MTDQNNIDHYWVDRESIGRSEGGQSSLCWAMFGLVILWMAAPLQAQSTSLLIRAERKKQLDLESVKGQNNPYVMAETSRNMPANPELEKVSLTAVVTRPQQQFKVHDLVGVIVREQKQYESDAKLQSKKKFEYETDLSKFFRMLNGHAAAASFTDGQPDVDFKMDSKVKGEGDTERNDKLTFRLMVEIVDIKPNGLLVLGGKQEIEVDEERQIVSFTGMCRREDVTPDNTVLSTQVFDQVINVKHQGAVRDASKRGWLTKALDSVSPF